MSRCRTASILGCAAAVLFVETVGACSGSLPWLRGDLANHPAVLVGQWVDVEKSTPGDSSFWVLRPDGEDDGLRIIRESPDTTPRLSRSHYGYWYVRAGGAGGEAKELCVTKRPSRDAPSCTAFRAGVDSAEDPPRRTIRLTSYAGAHHVGQRLLVERR